MLRTQCGRGTALRGVSRSLAGNVSGFHSNPPWRSQMPNAPLDLDPSLQNLLRDADMTMAHKFNAHYPKERPPSHRHMELIEEEEESSSRGSRKSPAAEFGSRKIGAVVLPDQLQESVTRLIENSDKTMLHVDAKRIFGAGDDPADSKWDSQYDVKYKSHKQAYRHSERDGTAFASVALPAHFSAIYCVLDHIKQRLGPALRIERVIDWGAGTGSGLWATAYSFQASHGTDMEKLTLGDSKIQSYLGIDKRDGLVAIAKRLLQNVRRNDMIVSWEKSFQEDDRIPRSQARDVLALSAFSLSSIPTPSSRRALVKQMWESGAHTIVIIDHKTPVGFECVAQARQFLLDMGAKEVEDPQTADWDVRGCHIVAPCPHDGACPLYHPGNNRLLCGFEQRLQRPEFVRKTKHSGVGHEDIGYSYVVIRRGSRPPFDSSSHSVGKMGPISYDEVRKDTDIRSGLMLYPDTHANEEHIRAQEEDIRATEIATEQRDTPDSPENVEGSLRKHAYHWPRLVFPPLKRSGHIILDSCTPSGKIMRLTIPKSQGKQVYYDARKSGWGDIFPHLSKNKEVERYRPPVEGSTVKKGNDIGKRGVNMDDRKVKYSYEKLEKDIKKQKKDERLRRRRERDHSLDLS
ncbi:Rsm22-domain-containing protein [Thelephora ganbajun]|uniref:Rsm22-domain-containing protein n=1 Tax=Thelephora ganbajun TaxID=370292 RepID=A0ACB6ZX95_THEGA|nr:Rsm22-domain-containing protein [Thelephora ganbajun]